MRSVVVILALLAVLAAVRSWQPAVRRTLTPSFLLTFAVLVVLTAGGALLWYWWQQPGQTFYGARWEDTTLEERSGATVQPRSSLPVSP